MKIVKLSDLYRKFITQDFYLYLVFGYQLNEPLLKEREKEFLEWEREGGTIEVIRYKRPIGDVTGVVCLLFKCIIQ